MSLAALQHRNFRLLWWGLFGSFTGSFMQNAAILWHVSLLVPPDRRALALGLVGLARVGPIVLFSMVSGVAADELDRPQEQHPNRPAPRRDRRVGIAQD